MNTRLMLFILAILVQSQILLGSSPVAPFSCSLPAPASITATNITSSTIEVTWSTVAGSDGYRVKRYDVTHAVQLPDVDVPEPGYTSGPHDPGTTIEFTVYSKCSNQELGGSIVGEYTTSIIIVDDVVLFTVPAAPINEIFIGPLQSLPGGVSDADKDSPDVTVMRTKLKYTDQKNAQFFAEILLWSQCSVPENNAAHLYYWQASPEVTHIEHHVNEMQNLPIISIEFKINTEPFFTLMGPTFQKGTPNQIGYTIRNDRQQSIAFSRKDNTEHNPCFHSSQTTTGGSPQPTELNPDTQNSASDDRTGDQVQTPEGQLSVHPNPFTGAIQLDFYLEKSGSAAVFFTDCTGQMLKQISLPVMEAGNHTSFIQASDLPAGMYALRLQTAEKSWTQMLVKAF